MTVSSLLSAPTSNAAWSAAEVQRALAARGGGGKQRGGGEQAGRAGHGTAAHHLAACAGAAGVTVTCIVSSPGMNFTAKVSAVVAWNGV